MKQLFLSLLLALAFVFQLAAQDNIVLKSGEEIKAKVEEVGLTEIKYKRTDNPTGPVYTVSKNDVLLINYQNGTKDVFNAAGKKDGQASQATPYPGSIATGGDYQKLHHLAVKKIAGGAVMIGVGAPVLLTGVGLTIGGLASINSYHSYNNNYQYDNYSPTGPLLAAGALLTAAGLALEIAGPLTLKKGLKYRRMAKEAKATMGFTPIIDSNLDRYSRACNQNKIGTLSFTF